MTQNFMSGASGQKTGFVGRNRTSLNHILRKYVQEYKDELKLMDEDFEEDENEEEDPITPTSPMDFNQQRHRRSTKTRSLNRSEEDGSLGRTEGAATHLNSSGIGSAGGDEPGGNNSQGHTITNYNKSVASFVNDYMNDSPSPPEYNGSGVTTPALSPPGKGEKH